MTATAPGHLRHPRHPLVATAARLAAEVLAPAAADVDATSVTRSSLEALAAAGLLGVVAPRSAGGSEVTPEVFRGVAEQLAGADAATWFVQAQHHTPVRMLAANPGAAADRYLPNLARGDLIAGIAFSHLRRFPERPVTAVPIEGGWRFDGVAPWYSGWGLNDVAFVAGVTDDSAVVFGVLPAREGGGVSVRARLRTAALDAAQTVALGLDGVVIADADVALVQPHAEWLAADQATSSNANPAIFGVGDSALAMLDDAATQRGEPATAQAAAALRRRFDDVRALAYALADEASSAAMIRRRLAVRAEALEVLIAITSGLVAANSGPAMSVTAPAQRKAREALFLLVQAQTAAARVATLERWAARHTEVGVQKTR
jgi:alkylation response protein AidB-like acyl-CoA dehydrogenase